jgi:putative Holliday junction resolvase
MDGSEGEQARKARAFGRRLERIGGLPTVYWDERLSSFYAEQKLRESAGSGRRAERRPSDDLAAAAILQSYLDAQRRRTGT